MRSFPTGNDGLLKDEGRADRAAGKVKDVSGSAKDKVDDAIDALRDRGKW